MVSGQPRASLGRRSRCPTEGDNMRDTVPESRVPRALSGDGGGRLCRPEAVAGEGCA
jgi:hypothetical protein